MKKALVILTCIGLFATVGLAQIPQAFKYQAIARDASGNILSNWKISLRVSIIKGDEFGQAVYSETHQVKSNIFGMINLAIGEGNAEKGDFEKIDWSISSHYIKMEIDTRGGTDYKDMGASQLYAVPYALYAEQAGNLVEPEKEQIQAAQNSLKEKPKSIAGNRNGTPNSKLPADDDSYLNVNTGNVGIGTTGPQEKLDVIGKIMASVGYNTNGDDGLSDTINLVSHIDFDNLKLKYRTLAFSGGILIYLSDTSAWVDTVGNIIQPPFICGDSLLDIRDGKKYATVLIGTQCWMAENLNVGTKINSNAGGWLQMDNDTIEKYCYNNDESQCDIYGGLYEWDEAVQYVTTEGTQGICPDGWHIPTDGEWTILTDYLGGESVAGGKMKSTGTIEAGTGLWYDPNTGATNESGFTGLPGGARSSGVGIFTALGNDGYFWSSSDAPTLSSAWKRLLRHNFAYVYRGTGYYPTGFSVRCLQD